ncbi:MAG: DUF1573 domain-containing protein [Prevotellaceae bacterium]|jgi:hypothetical protein|nr:DUF1573 domain-containing protein [Prevotellaceae bacterium]
MVWRNCFVAVLLFICFISCSNNKKINKEVEILVKEWTGKTIKIPDIQPTAIFEDSSLHIITVDEKYKILLYTDSTGCTRCKLQLHIWRNYIRELNSKVNFVFYFHPKTEQGLLSMLKYEQFAYPVYIDKNDELNKLNHFPNNPMFQCFLLDKDNKILAIGNPANNPKIWELYKQIITGEISDKPPVTVVAPEQTEIELKDLHAGKTSDAVFSLKNTGTQPLIIQAVNASCGCTVPEWDKQPVKTGKSARIKVRITPEEKGRFNKTVTVHCNTEKGQILIKVKGTVKE